MPKKRSPYVIHEDDVPNALMLPPDKLKGGKIKSKIVYGVEGNFMVATREGGYHSSPHRHDCEQLNYVSDGEIWIFIEDDGFLARKGDFFRIPRNAVHWSWIRSKAPCTLVEAHIPPITGDPANAKAAVGLFEPGEDQSVIQHTKQIFVSVPHTKDIETRVITRQDQ